MKLLLDQGLPRRAAALLRESGIDALHVGDLGMSSADDAAILAWCREPGSSRTSWRPVRPSLPPGPW